MEGLPCGGVRNRHIHMMVAAAVALPVPTTNPLPLVVHPSRHDVVIVSDQHLLVLNGAISHGLKNLKMGRTLAKTWFIAL